MAHYAFLDENNIVTQVITGRNEDEVVDSITDWESYYADIHGQTCKRTSYNTHGGENQNGGTPFRYNYAGIGYTFDPTIGTDGAFIPPKPYASWTLNQITFLWNPPTPRPEYNIEDPKVYDWNEETLSWVEVSGN